MRYYHRETYDYGHPYDGWRDNGHKRHEKPKGIENLGWASPEGDRGEDGGNDEGYKAYLFRHRGKVFLAIGCRRFTISEAYAHWNGIASVHVPVEDTGQRKRYRRAAYIRDSVIPRAERRARKLGWKV